MAIYIKDAAIKNESLVNGKIVDGTIEQVKLKDPYYTKTEIDTKIGNLDVTDTAVADQYVSQVSETDGKIAVTRTKLPVKDVKLNGTSLLAGEVADLKLATPVETKYTTNADGTINTQTKLEVATSKANDFIIGTDVDTIKKYVDDKVDEKLIAAGSGEMNILEGVKVGGTALSIASKNVDIQLDETKATGDNGVAKVELAGGKIKTTYDKFVETDTTEGKANEYGFFSAANVLTSKKLVDAWAATTSGSASAFDEAAGTYSVPTTKAVHDYLDSVLGGITGAMSFQGPASGIASKTFDENSLGWTFIATVDGPISGVATDVNAGDMFIVKEVTGSTPVFTHVKAVTTVVNKAATIGTDLTTIAEVGGHDITAKIDVAPATTEPELTTSSSTLATIAGKDIKAKLKDSSTTYTAGSITGSGESKVVTLPTLAASTTDGVVTGADIAKVSNFVADYVDKKLDAAGAGEMNKVDDVKVNGLSVVTNKIATIPITSTSDYGVVKLTDTYTATDSTMAMTGKAVASMLDDLTLAETGGTDKIVTTIKQDDGVVTATAKTAVEKVTSPASTNAYEYKVAESSVKVELPKATKSVYGEVKLDEDKIDSASTAKTNDAVMMTGKAIEDSLAVKKVNGNGSIYSYNATVPTEDNAIALGPEAEASSSAVAIGQAAIAEADSSISIGYGAEASGIGSIALYGVATNEDAVAISGEAKGDGSIAIGAGAVAESSEGIAIGEDSHSVGDYAIVLGPSCNGNGDESVVIGNGVTGNGTYSIAIGGYAPDDDRSTQTDDEYSIAIGYGSQATGMASVAIGEGAQATDYSAISIGNAYVTSGSQAIGINGHARANNAVSINGFADGEDSVSIGVEATTTAASKNGVSVGGYNVVKNQGEVSIGAYNKSVAVAGRTDKSTKFTVGNGTDNTDANRANTIEQKFNGDLYISGLGSYNGKNSDPDVKSTDAWLKESYKTVKPLQDVIARDEKIINDYTLTDVTNAASTFIGTATSAANWEANKYYDCGTLASTNSYVFKPKPFDKAVGTKCYVAQFSTGATVPTIVFPTSYVPSTASSATRTLKWQDVEIQPNKTYEISVINGAGVIVEI